jgi:hypothetical protein
MSPDPGLSAYHPGPWPAEDGGPRRLQAPGAGAVQAPQTVTGIDVVSRTDLMLTMVVTRDPGEVYLLKHGLGDDAPAVVERIDPDTLEPLATSGELPGGPMWPGSMAAHADGSLHVVFGNHAHRLRRDLVVEASVELPRNRPYNGFVVLPDGTLVTKDFAGSRVLAPVAPEEREPCELVALDPTGLTVLDRHVLPEPSIARLSALEDTVYVVGDTSLLRVGWDAERRRFVPDPGFVATYRTLDGQTYGWDCVLALGAAWFLDDGDGTTNFDASFEGRGISSEPLHLVRVDLETAEVVLTEVCGRPGGLIANPPLIDPGRRIAVAYDSGNGVMAAFDIADDGALSRRWERRQNHAAHLVHLDEAGLILSGDYDRARGTEEVVLLDIATGDEVARADTGGPIQSTVFPGLGHDGALYWCSMTTVSRLRLT